VPRKRNVLAWRVWPPPRWNRPPRGNPYFFLSGEIPHHPPLLGVFLREVRRLGLKVRADGPRQNRAIRNQKKAVLQDNERGTPGKRSTPLNITNAVNWTAFQKKKGTATICWQTVAGCMNLGRSWFRGVVPRKRARGFGVESKGNGDQAPSLPSLGVQKLISNQKI